MIWLDITDPKYVLFFEKMLHSLAKLDRVIVTSRESSGYDECKKLLDLFGIEAIFIGGYGGGDKLGKLQARIQRQIGFLELFKKIGTPKIFITGASVEGCTCAFGLGIPIVNFSDTPLAGEKFEYSKLTILSRLTLPLSSLVFRPFVVPSECYEALGVESKNIISYDFIDVAIWLKDFKAGEDFRDRFGIDKNKPTILVREEEYKAHYVKEKLPIIYESIELLSKNINANIVIMPRYESEHLHEAFGKTKNIFILNEKLEPNEFYPYIDLLIGGGGTMNLEACYLGIPVISARSLFLFHDRYLIQNNLMKHAKSPKEVLNLTEEILKSPKKHTIQKEIFEREEANFEPIIEEIKKRFF